MRESENKNKRVKLALLASFFVPAVIMLCIFIANGIYPFGDRSFLFSDMYHQYMPFFCEFVRSVKSGQAISFTWNVGIGSNFLALYVYYLASPLHWLAFLVPEAYIMEFMSYLVIVKIGLMGATSFLYLSSHSRKNKEIALFFSVFYALSGFVAAYNWNIMWLDSVILFPLIVLGLERLVKKGKSGLYCITLALSIFSNYYLSIMICLFLVLYFIYLFLTNTKSIKSILRFALYSLLAGGMAAILLIPEVCAILATDFGAISFPSKFEAYFSVLDMLSRHLMCVTTERALEHWPNIYCGVASLILIPLYALNQEIPAKKRFGMLALTGILLYGFSINIFNFIWHGLNYPDSLPARQSFIYILLVLTMGYESFRNMEGLHKKEVIKSYLIAVTFLLCIEKFVDNTDFVDGIVILNLIYVTMYGVVIYMYRIKKGRFARNLIGIVALILVVSESTINMAQTSVGTTSRTQYFKNLDDYQLLYEKTKEDNDGFYRMEKFTRTTKNDGTLVGYPTASVFSSTLNSDVMKLYQKLGMRYSKVYYGFDGATALTGALLNVNYMYGERTDYANELYKEYASSGNVVCYACNYVLPFGYVVPYAYDLTKKNGQNKIDYQNICVEELGIEGKLFIKEGVQQKGETVSLTPKSSGVYYGVLKTSGTQKLKQLLPDGTEANFKDLKYGEIVYLGHIEAGDLITLENADTEDDTPAFSMEFYRINTEVLSSVIDLLSKESMTDVVYTNDTISGMITLANPGRVVLSVPCEKGWRIKVNGEAFTQTTFGDALIALDLPAGKYEIELHYVPQGKWIGIWVTLISLGIFIALRIILHKKTGVNTKCKEINSCE